MATPAYLQGLHEKFSSKIFQQAQRLVEAGAVADIREWRADKVLTGLVQEAEGKQQRVYVQCAGAAVDGECSCAIGLNCAHVAAVLMVAAQQRHADDRNGRSAIRQTQPDDTNSCTTGDLQQRLVYVLTPAPLERHCIANACSVRLQLLIVQAGNSPQLSHANAQTYLPNYSRSGHYPRYVAASDKAILKQLSVFRATPDYCDPRGAAGATLIQKCVATGRCHWGSLQGQVLKSGPALSAPAHWRALPDGSQQVHPGGTTETSIITVNPPLYANAATAECGEWRLPVNGELLDRLLDSPAVQPDKVTVFNRRLAACDQLYIPAAPQLRCTTEPLSTLTGALLLSSAAGTDSARLRFMYNGMLCEQSELPPGQECYRYLNDGELRQLPRDPAGETALRRRLAEFFPLRDDSPGDRDTPFAQRRALPQAELMLPNEESWLTFMLEGLEQLRHEGWIVHIEDSFRYKLVQRERWYATLGPEANGPTPANRGNDWFNLELGIVVGNERVNLLPLLVEQLRRVSPGKYAIAGLAVAQTLPSDRQVGTDFLFELPDGGFLPVPLEQIQTILNTLFELLDGSNWSTAQTPAFRISQISRLHELATDLIGSAAVESSAFQWRGDAALQAMALRLKNFEGITALAPPASFQARLRPYQQEGLGWLQFLRRHDFGGVLADDMGLGKTVQALAHLTLEKDEGRLGGPSLLVAPTSLVTNWRCEAARFAPGLRVLVWHGSNRKQQIDQLAHADLIVTTYPLLNIDAAILHALHYCFLILDEAQLIKNSRAKATRRIKRLRAKHRLCLTGTPLENHLGELWSLFDFLMPGFLGTAQQFQRLYRVPIEKAQDGERQQALLKRIAPFMLRRTKQAVAAELPAKIEIVRRVVLADRQRDLYDAIRLSTHQNISRVIAAQGFARSQIDILDALMKLRQVCCDPRLLTLDVAHAVQESAKFDLLMTMLPELVAEGRRILLFSQFTSMLRLIETALQQQKIDYVILTGSTRDRATPVDRFQSGAAPLFLISLKAGGTGLNLTAADTVIHYDPWWNPAVETQATDRAHRIGQSKQVFVYKLICENTVEEKILQLQARKRALADGIYARQSAGPTELRPQDLEELFAGPGYSASGGAMQTGKHASED